MKLQENDVIFLLKKTGLSIKNLINLIEDDRDFDLVIHSIALSLTVEDYKLLFHLSNKLKVKLALYHTSKDKNYDISEKSQVSDILINNYDYIYKSGRVMNEKEKKPIKYFLSVIKDRKMNIKGLNPIINGLDIKEYHALHSHLIDWIKIARKSQNFLQLIKEQYS